MNTKHIEYQDPRDSVSERKEVIEISVLDDYIDIIELENKI